MSEEAVAAPDLSFSFQPAIGMDKLRDLEAAAQQWAVGRRVAFVIATKSHPELADAVRALAEDDAEAFFSMLDVIKGLAEYYENCLDLFKAVEARLIVAAHDAFQVEFE